MEWGTVIAAFVTTVGGVGVVMVQQGYAGGGRDYRRLRRLAELLAVLPAYSEAHRIVAGRLDRETREYFRTGVDLSLPDSIAIPGYPGFDQDFYAARSPYAEPSAAPPPQAPMEQPAYDSPWTSGPQAPGAPPPAAEAATPDWSPFGPYPPESEPAAEPDTAESDADEADEEIEAEAEETAEETAEEADEDVEAEEPSTDDRTPPPMAREAPPYWETPASRPPPPRREAPPPPAGSAPGQWGVPSTPGGPSHAQMPQPGTTTRSRLHPSGFASRALDRVRGGLSRLPGALTVGPILSLVAMAAAVLLQLLGHDAIGTVLSFVAVALTLLSLVGLLLRRSSRDRRRR